MAAWHEAKYGAEPTTARGKANNLPPKNFVTKSLSLLKTFEQKWEYLIKILDKHYLLCFTILLSEVLKMPGTKQGAIKAKKTRLERYGKDYYHRIGSLGGNPILLAIREAKKKQESQLPA